MLALVYQVPLGSEGRKVMLALKVYQALLGNEGRRAFKVLVVLLVPVVVEWSTPGGEGQLAQTHQELNWSMKEELLGVIGITKEEELTTSACQKPQTTTCRSLQELVDRETSMGQSMKPLILLFLVCINTMFHVLYVMQHQEELFCYSQQRVSAHPHGLVSTMAT